jgi:hypothetical protein
MAGSDATLGGAGGGSAQGGAGGNDSQNAAGAGGMDGEGDDLEPCSDPAVSRLKVWEMQVVGGTQDPSGSPLRAYQDGYEMHVAWSIDSGYGTANAPLDNQGEYANGANPAEHGVDVSAAEGLFLEYAAQGSTYVQLRTASVPHGGDHYRANIPATNGEISTVLLPFSSFARPGGQPGPGSDILNEVFSLTFATGASATLTLRQVRIDGLIPPCD